MFLDTTQALIVIVWVVKQIHFERIDWVVYVLEKKSQTIKMTRNSKMIS